jgi:hypothetical protein
MTCTRSMTLRLPAALAEELAVAAVDGRCSSQQLWKGYRP